jgi:hypothetical protein
MAGVSFFAAVALTITAIILFKRGRQPGEAPLLEKEEHKTPVEADEDSESSAVEIAHSKEFASQKDNRLAMLTLALLTIVGASLLLFKVLLVDKTESPIRRSTQVETEYPSGVIAGELQLEGFELSRNLVESGHTFDIDLAWRVLESPAADYQSNVWLVGPEGNIWSDKETARPRIYEDTASTTYWQPSQWAWDSREVTVLPGTPPGYYDIALILFDRDTLMPMTMTDNAGNMVGPMAVIGIVEVVAPESTPDFSFQYESDESIEGLTLLGYNQDRFEAAPGETLLLTLFWEKETVEQPVAGEFTVALLDESGMHVQTWYIPPVRADFPPGQWPVGAMFRGQHALRLEPQLESGDYVLTLDGTKLGQLHIGDLERLFVEPDYKQEVQATFSDFAELVGLTIGAGQSETITVTLVWKSLAEMPVSYRVFIHLVNEEGELVVQSDAEPAVWTRPTTGWIPGEYIVDTHILSSPIVGIDDRHSLRIGLYDPVTSHRLNTSSGDYLQLQLDRIRR